ncbi:hypothetical protein EYF80_044849 [Liparis tanakae]|uniref:Uncharacterized protein n=1 Tax=Liparis tanakae TaxID=230148 RepID=A0A4Z2FUL3_9TELE|nr:hypothetical protein EYF80_044849 [Liparis tanakae]
MGVKVGGVETQESPSGAWIRGSMDQGFVVPSAQTHKATWSGKIKSRKRSLIISPGFRICKYILSEIFWGGEKQGGPGSRRDRKDSGCFTSGFKGYTRHQNGTFFWGLRI